MKKTITILAVVIALVAGAAGIGWLYLRLNPAAWQRCRRKWPWPSRSQAA